MNSEAMQTRCTVRLCFVFVWISIFSVARSAHEFTNQFAVHVPEGSDEARKVAHRHGFAFHGQIGDLENYYLFEHNHVHKRSAEPSEHHHQKLDVEPKVVWFEQQVNKKRTKRDYVKPDLDEMPWEAAGIRRESDRMKRFNAGGPFSSFTQQPSHADLQRSVSPGNTVTSLTNFRDPFYAEQWYLHGGARGGYDMNVISCWKRGYSGKGVVISILDDGIQRDHPELALNYDPYASFDINDKDPDPMPQDNGDNKHGTRCAGEVSAVADNDVCGVGIAFNSSIGGVRMLDGPVNDAVEAHALSLNPDHIDIYSASWGPEDDGKTVDGPGPLARRAFINGIMKGRKGKGSIFVWASGNGGRHVDNCNCDGYTNSIFTLSISSATQRGLKPWYLEECASTLATTYSSGGPSSDKSVVTCDQDARLRPDRMCTVEHTGTSASAPIAAGICALALEANPNLTWRDMQYLVVMTSRPEPVLGERGWIVNGVKRKVSHKFGYGMMDADAMVSLAEKWSTVPSQHICQSRPDRNQRTIPAKYGGKMEASMSLDACAGTLNEVRYLEHVQCKISLRYLPRGNLRILLTSPMGTTSTLLFERPRDVTNANFDEWPFLSVHFWGEKADGTWVLQIINAGERRVAHPGLLRSWQLILYGTDINPVRLHSANARGKGLVPSPGVSAEFPELSVPPFGSTSDPHQPPLAPFNRPTNPAQDFSSGFFPLRSSFPNIFTLSGSSKVNSVNVSGSAHVSDAEKYASFEKSACHAECDDGCTGPTAKECISCKNVQFNNECMNGCPFGTYSDTRGVCRPCHRACAGCTGPDINQCFVCPPGKYYVVDESLCVSSCPEGYFSDDEGKQCLACSPNCVSCEGSAGHCTSCDHLFLFENKCLPSCPVKYYETQEFKCEPCHLSCVTCSGKSSDQCVTCPYPSKLWKGTCVPNCPAGTYTNEDDTTCFSCKAECETCVNINTCERCGKGFVNSTTNECVFGNAGKCGKGFFPDSGDCLPCHQNCLTCFGRTSDQCLSCPSLMYRLNFSCVERCPLGYHAVGAECVPCSTGCARCRSVDECLKCSDVLHNQGGVCQVSCDSGHYSERGDCKKCHPSCTSCGGPKEDECIQCLPESRWADGACVASCSKGFFAADLDDFKVCTRCHRSCAECKGPKITDCTFCPVNSSLYAGMCSPCVESQYYDQANHRCQMCHSKCEACNGSDEFSCTSCSKPLALDPQRGQCVPCCTSRSQTSCCQCDSTGGCVNPELHTRYAYDPAEKLTQDQAPKTGYSISYPGVIAAVFGFSLVIVLVWALYRRKRSGASKYTYQQLPVNARSKPGLPAHDLSWNADERCEVRLGDLESEEELEQIEFIKT